MIPAAEEADPPTVTRDRLLRATPGRATITRAREILHRCAPGRFLPQEREA